MVLGKRSRPIFITPVQSGHIRQAVNPLSIPSPNSVEKFSYIMTADLLVLPAVTLLA